MIAAARGPRARTDAQRFMHIDTMRDRLSTGGMDDLVPALRRGDLLVLNDAATLPASLGGRAEGRAVELRLVSERGDGVWRVVLFGEGSWRDDTDRRPAPPVLAIGDVIELADIDAGAPALRAEVGWVDPESPRLIDVRFSPSGDAFWRSLFRIGRPIQYSYLTRELALSEVQTPYGSRPWASELVSAGRPLTSALLGRLRHRGVELAFLTHAAGISATGDPRLDARLPFPERYAIPDATARAVRRALHDERRVVAVGTSTTRALEGVFRDRGDVVASEGETGLVIGPDTPLRVVDALLTGAHDPSSSHYQLLLAFAPDALLAAALERSEREGFLGHELGDSWLIT
ncbi:MAG: S-adenosylmethionine:tRNA ribosyltransferase-isomerase [Sandaracinaceae bacterium]